MEAHRQKEGRQAVILFFKCHFSNTRLYESAAESDAHQAALILLLSHICMHRQRRGMSVVGVAPYKQHRREFSLRAPCQVVNKFKKAG